MIMQYLFSKDDVDFIQQKMINREIKIEEYENILELITQSI